MARDAERNDDLPPVGSELCRFEELGDREGKELVFGGPFGFRLFLVRDGESVFAYENRCPHLGLTLNLSPDRFVSVDRQFLLCANHGALFRFADGLCLDGPCLGRALKPVPVVLRDGIVRLGEP